MKQKIYNLLGFNFYYKQGLIQSQNPYFLRFLLLFLLIFSFSPASNAEFNPKVKIVTTLGLYGTAGGALLGAASMAFGTSSRSIFQGASLGLYAGLLFGSYVVFSHDEKKDRNAEGYYPSMPENGTYRSGDGEGGGGDYGNGNSEYRFNPYLFHQQAFDRNRLKHSTLGASRDKGASIPLYLNLLQLQF